MSTCDKHNDCVVTYTSKQCPFCVAQEDFADDKQAVEELGADMRTLCKTISDLLAQHKLFGGGR